jgi:PAT family beta-lactamase induction signal transducer AmpG
MGQALGGAGVLYLSGFTGFGFGYVLVPIAILSVTVLVVLPLKEALAPPTAGGGWAAALGRMRDFVQQALRSFLGSRGAFAGVAYALLPNGAMALSLALQSNLAVEFGMNDDQVAALSLATTVVGAAGMVVGGWLSDRLGRRRTLAVFLVMMSLPALYLMWILQRAGYTMPRAPGSAPMPELIGHLWIAGVAYAAAMGLMYGPRTAVFMDITNPRVAATQFTAYMAMLNVGIAFAATWQGMAVEAFGYPITLLADAAFGLVSLPLLPLLQRPAQGFAACDERAGRRARAAATGLALACAAFVPWWLLHDRAGPAAGIANTLSTLAFVCAALFLFASTLLQTQAPGWRRACRWAALGLLLLYLRRFIAPADEGLRLLVAAGALLGAALLLRAARAPWPGLTTPPVPAPAPAAASGPVPAAGRESAAG